MQMMMLVLGSILCTWNVVAYAAGFSTGGHTVYHLSPATVDRSGERAVVTASYDGTVLCHRPDGRLVWQSHTNGSFPFALDAADITGDGLDESFAACSDGRLYAFGPDGALLWTFKRAAPLWAVKVTSDNQGNPLILTGGVDRILYALDRDGNIRGHCETDGVIRLIGCG